ncbi:hypothetical protein DL93DRAFT_263314 [Clavulina sp. PMI_390]|nr:hypothetical protein DL93DRAFT_263314 [Clavulina sp. PMI_390]
MRAALLAMPNLISYSLHIGEYNIPASYRYFYTSENKYARAFLPVDAPFRLRRFSCKGLAVNALLVRFLHSQPQITELYLPSTPTNFIIKPNVIPRLEIAAGPDPLVRRLILGRPVKALECTNPLGSHELQGIIKALAKSSSSITTLILPRLANVPLEDSLTLVASSLPSIESLAMSEHFTSRGRRDTTEVWVRDI